MRYFSELGVIILLALLSLFNTIPRADAVLTNAEGNVILDLMNSVTGLPTNWRSDQRLFACDNSWTGLRCAYDNNGVQRISIINLSYRVRFQSRSR
jgi:hypothetical protein